jgi:hypothetical protein
MLLVLGCALLLLSRAIRSKDPLDTVIAVAALVLWLLNLLGVLTIQGNPTGW